MYNIASLKLTDVSYGSKVNFIQKWLTPGPRH